MPRVLQNFFTERLCDSFIVLVKPLFLLLVEHETDGIGHLMLQLQWQVLFNVALQGLLLARQLIMLIVDLEHLLFQLLAILIVILH